ncbi:hypothetical protein [Tautonia marina]|uniref:hypothetical protein n=1 Tax=Tautonia marina TaxID=2653855 RepID=UPI0012608E56|nr:hypothetical protein [Tautonia marina]
MSARKGDNIEYTPEHRVEEADGELQRAHRHWHNVLKAVVDAAIKDRVSYHERELACIMEQVSEGMAHEFDHALTELEELCPTHTFSVTPVDSDKLIAAEAERLFDTFRPKPIDGSKLLRDTLRPIPTNPATKGFDHE